MAADSLARVTMPRGDLPVPGVTAADSAAAHSAPAAADTAATRPAPTVADTTSGPAPETAPPAVQVVGTIRVVGNVATDSTRILRSFEVPSGMRYSREAVARGVVKLHTLGLFEDIWVDRANRGQYVDLVIHVVERPRITKIQFAGNKRKDTEELERKLSLRVGDPHSEVLVQTQIDSLLKFYRDDGYPLAKIEAVTDTSGGGRVLRFVIHEGEKVKITDIQFTGVTVFQDKLRKALKTKKKGLLRGGKVDEEKVREDLERLAAYYHDHGYRDARVMGYQFKPGPTPRELTLEFAVEEGRYYRMGNVTWAGSTVLPNVVIQNYWERKDGEPYNRAKIEKAQGSAYADYAEHGYLYVSVEAQETVRDSVVDVTFQIAEGQPSHVRLVTISGNKATREKVIRRDISVREGDRFKRSVLVRSQGDLMRLGFFEEVIPDFAPAESTDVDIIFRVKEKSVGTASAGAGYTGESGLSGFLEIGHNNVLGNGQSLQLHLERGARTSNYSISFTEPWFRDTPTLLGVSVFNYRRERDPFEESSRGGSVRVGRPLRWPDYSRGSLAYSIESARRDPLRPLTALDSIAFAGIDFGKRVLTSTMTATFLRNSTNHPLYPTGGGKTSITSEFAGGLFGGVAHFNKHRIEQRVWLPSLLKPFTTMIRGRVGILGRYAGQHSAVPLYERFRLGGGTTPDPLRGYDDYTVVPDKFNRLETTTTQIIIRDSTGTPTDTLTTSRVDRVRYPGGRYMVLWSFEQQFPVVHPLHGVLFFDAGNTWDEWREIKPFDLRIGAGAGFRLEIPLLGMVGFDWGYGFNRDDRPKGVVHFLIGQVSF